MLLYTCQLSLTVPDPCLMDPCDVNADCVREGLLSPNFIFICILMEMDSTAQVSSLLQAYNVNLLVY